MYRPRTVPSEVASCSWAPAPPYLRRARAERRRLGEARARPAGAKHPAGRRRLRARGRDVALAARGDGVVFQVFGDSDQYADATAVTNRAEVEHALDTIGSLFASA